MYDAPIRTMLDKFKFEETYLKTCFETFGFAVANGSLYGKEPLDLVGYNGNVPVGSWEPIWETSTAYTWQTADQTLKVASSDADDTAAGNGARTIRIWWLDSAHNESTVDVEMNGLATVATAVATARRVNRVEVLTAGTTGTNEGVITVYATDAATRMSVVLTGWGRTTSCIQTVPYGKRDIITNVWLMTTTAADATRWVLFYRTSITSPWLMHGQRRLSIDGDTLSFQHAPLHLEAGSDYWLGASAPAGATACYGIIEGCREDA